MKVILRDILTMIYGIGIFELWKIFIPDINKDWLFIIVFISLTSIIMHCVLKEHDEWKKEKELEEVKSKKWLNRSR